MILDSKMNHREICEHAMELEDLDLQWFILTMADAAANSTPIELLHDDGNEYPVRDCHITQFTIDKTSNELHIDFHDINQGEFHLPLTKITKVEDYRLTSANRYLVFSQQGKYRFTFFPSKGDSSTT